MALWLHFRSNRKDPRQKPLFAESSSYCERSRIDAPPDLSLFAFHLTRPGASSADEDAMTKALMERTTARGRVMVTGAVAHGRYLGRVCVLSFRTHQERIDALVDDFAAVIREL